MVLAFISRLAFLILLFGFSLPAARADTSSEIQSVIADQLDAFGKDDDTRAYDHASDMIKQLFLNLLELYLYPLGHYCFLYPPILYCKTLSNPHLWG